MSVAEPGVTPCCVYCHFTDDTLPPFLPCGDIICRACCDGTSSGVVRVISPYATADHKDEAAQCVFCSAAVRTSKVASAALDMLRCVTCAGVCQNACEVACGHTMCESCAQHVCRTRGVCHACRHQIRVEDIVPSRALRRRVNDLVFMCKYGVYGCVESGKVEGLSQHEAQCECGERVCDGCGRCVKRNEWQNHLGECVAVQLDCPHLCGARLSRIDMAIHASQCGHHTQRKDMAQHQADLAAHLRLMQQLQDVNHQLRNQLQQTSQQQQHTIEQQQHTIQQLQLTIQQQQQTNQQLQQSVQRQQQTIEQLQQQVVLLQQQLAHQQQDLQEQQEKQAEKHATRDICPIGYVVRHVPVFEPATTCYGVTVTGDRLYLSDFNYHVVEMMDAASGDRVTRYGTLGMLGKAVVGQPPRFYGPWGVAVDETRGRVYVADCCNHCVVVVRLCDGMVEAVWGSQGSGQQQFWYPRGLAYCPATDLLYVADGLNHSVKGLRGSDGECVQVLGTGHGNCSHQMNQPFYVEVDAHHVYISDTENHRVLVYAKQTGLVLFQLGQGQGSGNTQFNFPCGLSVDSEAGVVYVADYNNYRVCVYRSGDGSYDRHFQVLHADNTEAKPYGVMWNAVAGVLYVTLENSSTICVYPY